jgi:hemerythrin-like domain-containing protein
MKADLDGPADTSLMGIVHDAMRRDLARTRYALTTAPHPEEDRRRAIAGHLDWLMNFLHNHHTGEDAGLYPAVRAANPAAGQLLDAMDAEHQAIDPGMAGVRSAARRWGGSGSDTDRTALVQALDALGTVLLPHLEREESEAMPVVSASITHRQWQALDQQHNIKGKSMPQLAEEGHFLIDGLDERRRQIVLHLVPAAPRWIMLYGFGPGYRRRAAARWGKSPAAAGSGAQPPTQSPPTSRRLQR